MSELKPCPFCGGEPTLSHNGMFIHEELYTKWNVKCNTCKIDFESTEYCLMKDRTFESLKDGRATAIENWNRRANEI